MRSRLLALGLCLGVAASTPAEPRAQTAAASATPLHAVEGATRQMLRGQPAADAAMRAALARWVTAGTRTVAPAAGSLEADVLAIRDAVFLPLGNALLRGDWNADGWPASPPAFLMAPGQLTVTGPGLARPVSVDVARQPPGLANVVFVSEADLERLAAVVSRLGGAERREPGLMDVPNQPAGGAERILAWWNGFFPARPGHWEGVDVESAPAFRTIEFTDAARTQARVPVGIGYAGATVILEKVDGVWTMRGLDEQWVM